MEFNSHVVKFEVIMGKILGINNRGENRFMNKKEEVKENKCNSYFILDSDFRFRMVKQFLIRGGVEGVQCY